jgi:hypothetical protein
MARALNILLVAQSEQTAWAFQSSTFLTRGKPSIAFPVTTHYPI